MKDEHVPSGTPGGPAGASFERIFRTEYARVVASLIRRFGDFDIAEDAVGEAIVMAIRRWPAEGIPPNPGGWLTTTATRRAIDRIRRESTREQRQAQAVTMMDHEPAEPVGVVDDDRLRLIFTCCHPALALEARVALTLRLLCGLTVAEVARAFLVPERTMAQRLTRAKRKIRTAGIPYRVPQSHDLLQRLAAVLAVVYLVFNEGYLVSAGSAPTREDLSAEAIRLCRVLAGLLPDEPEIEGLLALMLLTEARRPARFQAGRLITLDEQDRQRWDKDLIDEGLEIVRGCLRRGRPGRYQILAAINAVHADAPDAEQTDWAQILALYDQLMSIAPTPVVALNRAVALAEVDGPRVALPIVDRLDLSAYHPWHVARAALLERIGRTAEARDAYDAALAVTDNVAERSFLMTRRDALPS